MEWSQMEQFKGIDLNDSFVLNWSYERDRLSFEIEASIWPESEHYTIPKKDEYTCYRKAKLEFVGVEKVTGLKPENLVRSTTDPNGSVDYGNIDQLEVLGESFIIAGDFGSVTVLGGKLRFEVQA